MLWVIINCEILSAEMLMLLMMMMPSHSSFDAAAAGGSTNQNSQQRAAPRIHHKHDTPWFFDLQAAMKKEFNSLMCNGIYTLVPLPLGYNVILTRWLY